MTPGKDTSEYKFSVRAVAALVVAILTSVVASGLLPPEHFMLKVVSGLISLGGMFGIGQVVSAYTKGRSQLKSMMAMPPLPSGSGDD